jgi:prepilin-type N-terminal cleavage/methylation domain-containing protein
VLRRRPGAAGEAGFTLVELLLSIAVLGIVLGSVVAASFVAARTTATSKTRLDDSNDLVVAATYFGDDVQGAQGVTVDSDPLCGPDDDAVVEFAGQDFADDSTLAIATTVVTYVLRGDDAVDDPTFELHRLSCRADSTGPAYPLTPVTDVTVAAALSGPPTVSCGGAACGPGFTQVGLSITTDGGFSVTLTGRRRTTP